jgi:phosphatidate cytidylyltransferase
MLGATLAALGAGSMARLVRLRHADKALRDRRLASLRTWWMLTVVGGACLLAGRPGVCLLLAVASSIGWREYTAALGTRSHDQPAVRAGYAIVVINYALILFDRAGTFVVFVPVGALLILAVAQLLQGQTTGYIRMTGGLFWGLMFLVYGLSHAALLFILLETSGGPVGPAGWLLYLLILTEANDIFQSVIGRNLGAHKRHRITPTISPNKTWEGFLGGMLVTIGLAVLLAPWLTTLGHEAGPLALPHPLRAWATPVLAGLVVAIAGFFGDINMSAIKRDAGVKDSSTLLPGMGGLIDRIDSLTITAPVFVYFLIWWIP